MTRVLNRSQRRKIKNFNKIIRASYKVFSKKGLFRATFDEISEVADIGKGTIYSHFRNKMHLVSYLAKQAVNDLLSYCKAEVAGIENPREIIGKLIKAHFTFFARRKALFNILFFIRGALHQDFENRYIQEMASHYEKYMNFLADSLDYGIKEGAFRQFHPMNQAYILHGIIVGFISQWIINGRKETFADKADQLTETFLQGIVSKEPQQKGRKRSVSLSPGGIKYPGRG